MDGRCNHIPKTERRLTVQEEGKGIMKVMGISKARKVGQEELFWSSVIELLNCHWREVVHETVQVRTD